MGEGVADPHAPRTGEGVSEVGRQVEKCRELIQEDHDRMPLGRRKSGPFGRGLPQLGHDQAAEQCRALWAELPLRQRDEQNLPLLEDFGYGQLGTTLPEHVTQRRTQQPLPQLVLDRRDSGLPLAF